MIKSEMVARLLLINLSRFSSEKGKGYSRIKISKKSLRKTAGRALIRDAFIEALQEELFGLGWHFGVHSDTEYYLIEKRKLDSWGKVACSRIEKEIEGLKNDPDWYADKVEEIFKTECGEPENDFSDEE